jgi:hypothetical protein
MIHVKQGDVFHIRLFENENWSIVADDGLDIFDSHTMNYYSTNRLVPEVHDFMHLRDWDVRATKPGVYIITATNPEGTYDPTFKPYTLTVYVE